MWGTAHNRRNHAAHAFDKAKENQEIGYNEKCSLNAFAHPALRLPPQKNGSFVAASGTR